MNLIVGEELMAFFLSPDVNLGPGDIKQQLTFLQYCPNYQYASDDILVYLFKLYCKFNNAQTSITKEMRVHLRQQLLDMVQIGADYALAHISDTSIMTNYNGNDSNGEEDVNELIKQDVLNAIKAIDYPTFHYQSYRNCIINVNDFDAEIFYPMLIAGTCIQNGYGYNSYMSRDEKLIKTFIKQYTT